MATPRIRARFVVAGLLFVVATIASGIWSAYTFTRLSRVIGDTLAESQQRIDLTAILTGALEREDDALLLAVSGDVTRAAEEVRFQRALFDDTYDRLRRVLTGSPERAAASSLRLYAQAYRAAGDSLLASARQRDARARYHEDVNPILRKAVSEAGQLRELTFRSMQQVSAQSRDQARRATGVVLGVSLVALIVSTVTALHLARAVVRPIHELTESVEAIRRGEFDRRVRVRSSDELGILAEGFNRMAETLAEFRRSNLGEVVRAKETLEATLAALPDGVIVVDPDGRIAAVNALARSILRAAGAERASRLEELPLPADHLRAASQTLLGLHRLSPRSQSDRTLSVTLDDREFRFAPVVMPIQALSQGRVGAVIVLTDVTDFVRLDELRAELIALVSHELKTPLTTLRMNLLMLGERSDDLTPRQREILATAIVGCEELASTIDELLDLSRIEAGQLRLALARVDVLVLVEQAVRAFRSRYDEAGVDLSVVCHCPQAVVLGDGPRLALVLSNLLTNALSYTPPGGRVVVGVSAWPNAGRTPAELLHIAVTDTGPGIPEEFRQRVFEKFFRIDTERSRARTAVQGAGFGLYLCRQIIEAHGGSIRCEPGDAGRGTRIVLELAAAPLAA
jgi:NtrC-family two-component system sensor histidine kinase KinB